VSSAESRAAWDELRRIVAALPAELSSVVGGEWARAAQFEHASIASFGRFALELLAVGAPSELVAAAHRAALDEIEHARLCFSLASLYSGVPRGPGPLPLDARAFNKPNLATMTHATVLEGCVNETLAALEAEKAAAHAEPLAVRESLLAIEQQESDHASLAFEFVSWAIAVGGAPIRAVARDAFAFARDQIEKTPEPANERAPELERALMARGRLPASARYSLRRRVFNEVLLPAAEKLVASR
jgi:hypothetical protein